MCIRDSNYNIDKTEPFKIITEYAKEAGKKVGVISTVSLNHATPAAYYAKMPSRNEMCIRHRGWTPS